MEGVTGSTLETRSSVGGFRWVICALLFAATTINYIDRQIIGILKPELQRDLGWTEIEYSNIVLVFQLAYAISLVLVGRLIDRIGTLRGFSLSVIWWSFAAMGHALAHSVMGFGVARFLLGLGEGGNFPASNKTVAEWFPKKERALTFGLFNAGTNVGAIVTPVVVPWIVVTWGWRAAFVATGAIGFLWLFFWHALYRRPEEHPRLSKAELAYIQSDPPDPPSRGVPWVRLLPLRQTWAFALGKFMTDPFWWFYLFWVPDFLQKSYGLNLQARGLPLAVIYIVASVGSVGGGWLSGALIRRGWTVNAARKTTMLACALAVVPIVFASHASSMWEAVAFVSLAAAAHQGFSANIFTTTSDMFPRYAVGSVTGIGGMAGAVGGMLVSKVVGYVLEWTGSYTSVFMLAGSAYLLALLVIHLLVPHLEPAELREA
jgi:MFS transporter, ACS family, aldohexuronate transporter